MLILPLEQIVISENRQRREFSSEALQELADSISRNGLLQPLVVRPGESNSSWILVCGERRLRAIRDYMLPLGYSVRHAGKVLDEGHVPVVDVGDLLPEAAEEAELEENIRRVDLSWQERAVATARLNALRSAQATTRGEGQPSVADIALEVRDSSVGSAYTDTRKEILIAKHLRNPAVAAAKTLEEAWKALKRVDALKQNAELAAAVGKTFSASLHQAIQADSLEWMADAESEQFDVILTDPPYGMGADEFGDSGGKGGNAQTHRYEDSYDSWVKLIDELASQSYRLAKPQAHLYCFCDIDNFLEARSIFSICGWKVFRTPLIWHKPSAIRAPWPQMGPWRKWEMILYAVKGDRPVTQLFPDLVSYPPDANLNHSAQKPVALFEDLLKRSVRPGDKVFDPFCGTGTIFPAAHTFKCTAVGIERDVSSYGISLTRIQSLKKEEE